MTSFIRHAPRDYRGRMVCLPVVATRDNGSEEQITGGATALCVPHESPREVASAVTRLLQDRTLAGRFGTHSAWRPSANTAMPEWQTLFQEVVEEHRPGRVILADSR